MHKRRLVGEWRGDGESIRRWRGDEGEEEEEP